MHGLVSSPKSVMNDIRVSQLVISITNNGTAVRLYLYVGTVSQTVRSGNGPYIKRNHARPALLTVFSTTQLGYSISQLISICSRIWNCFPGALSFMDKSAVSSGS